MNPSHLRRSAVVPQICSMSASMSAEGMTERKKSKRISLWVISSRRSFSSVLDDLLVVEGEARAALDGVEGGLVHLVGRAGAWTISLLTAPK